MGTLDDAIREHLELKKRLGASDDEIKEKESQAFGKGARPAPAESEPAREEPLPEPAGEGDAFVEHDLPAAEPAPNGQPAAGEWEPAAGLGPSERAADEIFEPDEVPAEEALDPGLTVRDQRVAREPDTVEPLAEDVLEETPEFLEETPEHDRLWFEQRPPKDFDFD
jgi:hypothetical protein